MGGDKMKLTKACGKSSNDTGNADGPCFKDIGGVTGQLPEQNTQTLDCVADNLASCQIHGEINPFSQAGSNLSTMMKELNGSKMLKRKLPLGLKLTIDEKLLRDIDERLTKSRRISSPKSNL